MKRCAIYTRAAKAKNHDQRQRAEAFVAKMGWHCLSDRYDDNGCSGMNLDRPELQRLLRDIESGKIDCVVVCDISRISRSPLDLHRLMDTFERYGVSVQETDQ